MRARTLIAAVGLALIGLAPSMSSEQTCTPRTYWVMPGGGCRFWDGSAYNVCCAVQAFLCGTEGDVPPKSVSQVQLCDGSDYAAALSTWPDSCGEMCSTGSSVDTCRPPREFPSACNDARGDVDCKGAVNVNCAKLNAPFAGKETAAAGGDACRGVAGADPILLGSQSAVTEPFTDFSVDRISRLSITRSYNSSDSNLQAMGTGGVFANAWHHDWEAEVTCTGDACMVLRGTLTGFKFARAGSYPSPDGLETRTVYVPSGGPYT